MASSFISALVIKHNNTLFKNDDNGVIGKTMSIPTPGSGGSPHGDFWAVPVADYGVFTGFKFEPTTPNNATPPTLDSFHVFLLVNENAKGRDSWWVRGRTTYTTVGSPQEYGYIQAAADAECCDATPGQLPTDLPLFSACQEMCQWDANGKYFAIWQLPSLSGNLRYLAYGRFNGVALTALTATGYTSGALLATGMTSAWGTAAGGTFTFANNALQLVQTAGDGDDVICVTIATVNPSA